MSCRSRSVYGQMVCPDIAAIGRAFGGAGHTVTNRADLAAALKAAAAEDRFTVIAAVIDRQAYDGRL